jgi:hypothetical protein
MAPKRSDDGLSGRERRFVDEYLVDLNASKAAVRAGYSPKFATHKSHLLLRRPAVKAAIDEGLADVAARVGLNPVVVLKGLMLEAENAKEGGARVRAYELLGKYLEIWPSEKHDVEVGMSLEALVLAAPLGQHPASFAPPRPPALPVTATPPDPAPAPAPATRPPASAAVVLAADDHRTAALYRRGLS